MRSIWPWGTAWEALRVLLALHLAMGDRLGSPLGVAGISSGHGGPPGKPFGCCWHFIKFFLYTYSILKVYLKVYWEYPDIWPWGTAWETLWVLLASKTCRVVFFLCGGGLSHEKNNLFIDILTIYVGGGSSWEVTELVYNGVDDFDLVWVWIPVHSKWAGPAIWIERVWMAFDWMLSASQEVGKYLRVCIRTPGVFEFRIWRVLLFVSEALQVIIAFTILIDDICRIKL